MVKPLTLALIVMTQTTFLIKSFVIGLVTSIAGSLMISVIMGSKGTRRLRLPKPLIQIVWTAIITIFVILVLFSVETRWALDIKFGVLVVVISIALVMATTWLAWFLAVKKRIRIDRVFCGGILLLASLGYFVDRALPRYVSVDCPSFVGDTATIRGRVARWGKWDVRVMVRPLKSGVFYIQQIPLPDAGGEWRVECNFGGVPGDRFEVLAIASYGNIPFEEGQTIIPRVPNGIHRSRSCEVEKR